MLPSRGQRDSPTCRARSGMAMAMLLVGFDIESVDVPGGGEAQDWMAFTMSPVGLRLRLRER